MKMLHDKKRPADQIHLAHTEYIDPLCLTVHISISKALRRSAVGEICIFL